MIRTIIENLEATFGGAVVKFFFALALVAWLTFWGTTKAVEIRDAFAEFERSQQRNLARLENKIDTNSAAVNRRIDQVELATWTLQMMIEHARISADWNPTNKTPDPYRIWRDVREGRVPTGVRIGPQ